MFYKNTDGIIMAHRKILKEENYLQLEVQLVLFDKKITRVKDSVTFGKKKYVKRRRTTHTLHFNNMSKMCK